MGKKGVNLPSARAIESDPPVDFLVKNMVECDSELLRDQLLSDLQYASLCDMETSVSPLLKNDLMTSWIHFYQAHGRLFDLVVWLVRKEMAEGKSYPQVSSPLLCHLTKMLLHIGEDGDSLLPSPEKIEKMDGGEEPNRIQEKCFSPLIQAVMEKEKEEGITFSTPQDLLRFLFQEKKKEGFWDSSNFPPLLKFLVKFMKKERDRSLNFLSFADSSKTSPRSPRFLSRSRVGSPSFASSGSPSPTSGEQENRNLYPDSVYSLVIVHFLCAMLKENGSKIGSNASTPVKHSNLGERRSERLTRSFSARTMEELGIPDTSSTKRIMALLSRGLKEVAGEYLKEGQPQGPFSESENEILLRFGHALRGLWDDLCEDVVEEEVEKKAHCGECEETQREALGALKTNLALCQSRLDEDLPGSSDLYARHFTDSLRYMTLSEDGWELLKVKKHKDGLGHDLSVWMKLPEGSPFHLFKASKVFPVSVPTMFNFLRDVQNNFKTDKSLTTAEVVHTYTASRKLVYIRNHFAWPMDDRDCLMSLNEMISPDFQEAIIAGHSVELPSFPPTKGIDRVFLLISGYYIEAVQIEDNPLKGSKGKATGTSWKKDMGTQKKKTGCRVSYLIQCKTDSKLIPSSVLISIMKNTMRTKLDLEDHVTPGDISEIDAKNLPVRRRDISSRMKNRGSEMVGDRKPSPTLRSTSGRFARLKKSSPRRKRRTSVGVEAIQKPEEVQEVPEEVPYLKRSLNAVPVPVDPNATAAVITVSSFTDSSEGSLVEEISSSGPPPDEAIVPRGFVKTLSVYEPDEPLDLPLEELLAMMVSDVEVSDRYYKRKMFPKTFFGRDFIAWLMLHNIAKTIYDGLQIGNDMIELGMLWPVQENVDRMQDDDSLYRFASHAIDLASAGGFEGNIEGLMPQLGQRINATSKQCSQLSQQVQTLKMEMSYIRHNLEKLEESNEKLEGSNEKLKRATEALAARPIPAAPVASVAYAQPVHNTPQREFSETHLILCCLLAVLSSFGSMILPTWALFLFQIGALGGIGAIFVLGRKEKDASPPVMIAQPSLSQLSGASMAQISSPSLSLPSASSQVGDGEQPSERDMPIEPTVAGLRTLITREFGREGISQYQDDYIQSVIDVPTRSFEQSVQKFRKILGWRTTNNVDGIIKAQGEGIMRQLCEGCLYMYGYNAEGHPLFWVKPHLKDYKRLDVEKEIIVHILMLELGIKSLPTGINTFVLVAEAGKLGMRDFSPALMKGLINLLTSGYPDRLEGLYAGPINFVVRMIYKALSPIVPARLLSKVHLVDSMTSQLKEIIPAKYVDEPHPSFEEVREGGEKVFSLRKMIEIQKEEARAMGLEVPLLDELLEKGYGVEGGGYGKEEGGEEGEMEEEGEMVGEEEKEEIKEEKGKEGEKEEKGKGKEGKGKGKRRRGGSKKKTQEETTSA